VEKRAYGLYQRQFKIPKNVSYEQQCGEFTWGATSTWAGAPNHDWSILEKIECYYDANEPFARHAFKIWQAGKMINPAITGITLSKD
jgi:hypothetical protein